MPYDPNFPATRAELISASFRNQFHGLKDLIDANGGLTSVVVDSVTAVGPGQPPSVTLSVIGTVLHASFALPEGQPGAAGAPGAQGPPFSNVVIDSITTLDPGANATVFVYFDGTLVHLSFGIPRGAQGEQGIQGPPGEVTTIAMNGAMASAIAGTSNNTNAIPTMDTPFADNPDAETLRQAFNALVLGLRR
jgi:hypothetical protein